jgi:hypothetical protein
VTTVINLEEWRILYIEQVRDLYCSLNIVKGKR